jgi:hypothetical protein
VQHRDSSSWSVTTAITQTATIVKAGRGEGSWEATLLYSYQTGEYQSGEQTRTFLNESDARAFFASIENQQLTVRFDPAAPSVSELAFD